MQQNFWSVSHAGGIVTLTFAFDPNSANKIVMNRTPAPPTVLKATLNGSNTRMIWTASTDLAVTKYNIYAKSDGEQYLQPIGAATGTSYDTTDPWASTPTRIYAVAAVKADGSESFLSEMVQNDDRDLDGLSDAEEATYGTNVNNPDTDGDGLKDGEEVLLHGTDPLKPDTDGDSYTDYAEVQAGTDPLDPNSFPGHTYAITAGAGVGGTIVPSGVIVVNAGESKTFTITPNPGYQIADVLVDDLTNGPLTTYTFTDINANHTIAASFAPLTIYTISGSIRNAGGAGIAGAVLNGLPGNPTTDANGAYSATVNSGWSGTVTPQLGAYTFTPINRVYTNVTTNQTNQNYTGAYPACTVRKVCNGNFEQGLTSWSSTENATLVTGRTGRGVQIAADAANSDVYQFMKPDPVLENNVFPAGKWYQATAWCLADVGEDCGIYLGDANTWYNPPAHQRTVRKYLPGNGQWQPIAVVLYLDAPEILSVYLYASKPGSTVIYDDVEIHELACTSPRTVCNGDFEQALAFWSSTSNASLTTGRTGQGLAVTHDTGNSDVYQFMKPDPVLTNNVFPAGKSYQASAWCLADVGEDCGIYLGDANTWYNPPDHQREARTYLPGTGQWQPISALLYLDAPEILSVYLYASKPGSTVIYDDVEVKDATWQTWYLAEGYTNNGTKTYIGLLNPNPQAAQAQLTFINGDGTTTLYRTTIPAHSRKAIDAGAIVPNQGFSTKVETDLPVVAERSMYWPAGGVASADGHNSIGVATPSKTWYFAEGYNSTNSNAFKTYLTLFNPNAVQANLNVLFLKENGTTQPNYRTLPAMSRQTVITSALIPDGGFAMHVTADQPIIAERAMYWNANGVVNAGGHDTIGAAQPATTWYLAEGENSDAFQTYITLLNPNTTATTANVTFIKEDGSTVPYTRTLPAQNRQTILTNAANLIPNGRFAAIVTSGQPIVAERTMYWTAGGVKSAGGHNTIGASTLATTWYFAEGYTSGNNASTTALVVLNPNTIAATVNVTFIKDDGATVPYSTTVPARKRITINTNALIPAGGFGAKVASSLPIAVERVMYWSAGGVAMAGGHCSIGVAQQWTGGEPIVSPDTFLLWTR